MARAHPRLDHLLGTHFPVCVGICLAGMACEPNAGVGKLSPSSQAGRTVLLPVCQPPLAPIPSEPLELYLSPREQKLAEVKSVQWPAHYCAQCYPELDNPAFSEPLLPTAGADAGAKPEAPSLERPFHLFALDQSRLNFEVCPSCDEKALKRTIKILKEATTEREGMMETTLECKMCDHIDMSHRVIPMKPKTAD